MMVSQREVSFSTTMTMNVVKERVRARERALIRAKARVRDFEVVDCPTHLILYLTNRSSNGRQGRQEGW
jgi:hypothetical protein